MSQIDTDDEYVNPVTGNASSRAAWMKVPGTCTKVAAPKTQDHEVRCAQQTEKADVGVWIDMQIVLCIDCVSCDRLNLRIHS